MCRTRVSAPLFTVKEHFVINFLWNLEQFSHTEVLKNQFSIFHRSGSIATNFAPNFQPKPVIAGKPQSFKPDFWSEKQLLFLHQKSFTSFLQEKKHTTWKLDTWRRSKRDNTASVKSGTAQILCTQFTSRLAALSLISWDLYYLQSITDRHKKVSAILVTNWLQLQALFQTLVVDENDNKTISFLVIFIQAFSFCWVTYQWTIRLMKNHLECSL